MQLFPWFSEAVATDSSVLAKPNCITSITTTQVSMRSSRGEDMGQSWCTGLQKPNEYEDIADNLWFMIEWEKTVSWDSAVRHPKIGNLNTYGMFNGNIQSGGRSWMSIGTFHCELLPDWHGQGKPSRYCRHFSCPSVSPQFLGHMTYMNHPFWPDVPLYINQQFGGTFMSGNLHMTDQHGTSFAHENSACPGQKSYQQLTSTLATTRTSCSRSSFGVVDQHGPTTQKFRTGTYRF